QRRKQELLEAIARRVLEVPESASSTPNSRWDGLLEVPAVTVLSARHPALVPGVRVLHRGDLDRPRDPVKPDPPPALRPATAARAPVPAGSGSRARLARWLTRPDHPLTARVIVNRVWQWHFGAGLVATPNDFGKMGQPPSHPELLDWLAVWFVDN